MLSLKISSLSSHIKKTKKSDIDWYSITERLDDLALQAYEYENSVAPDTDEARPDVPSEVLDLAVYLHKNGTRRGMVPAPDGGDAA